MDQKDLSAIAVELSGYLMRDANHRISIFTMGGTQFDFAPGVSFVNHNGCLYAVGESPGGIILPADNICGVMMGAKAPASGLQLNKVIRPGH